jgi:hypothetical protein
MKAVRTHDLGLGEDLTGVLDLLPNFLDGATLLRLPMGHHVDTDPVDAGVVLTDVGAE